MIPRKKRQRHKEGDVFGIPLNDGRYAVGQVLDYPMKHCPACAFFDVRIDDTPTIDIPAPLPQERIFAILVATKDHLSSAHWPVLCDRAIGTPVAARPYERFRVARWVGLTIYGSGIIEAFTNAYFALAPWDQMAEPDYFDQMLLNTECKPKNRVYSRAA